MKATETRIIRFLAETKTRFVIPVYQRNYAWSSGQCEQLLNDIFKVGKNKKVDTHFIGSIVFVHDDVYTTSGIRELVIIDGQQRLTTLTLIYLVLHRLAKKLKNETLASEIEETYLINKFSSEEEKIKLRPAENNDKALECLLRGEDYQDFSKLVDNFNYFMLRITEENYESVREGLAKLTFVEISLDRNQDDPQRIFESLNSTGLELSQADLIRNYILMGLNRETQDKIYKNYWEPIENFAKDEASNDSKVSDYIRDYLTLVNNKIPNKNKVYFEFKIKYPTPINELEEYLAEIKKLAVYYNKLINPKKEEDKEIRFQLESINRLDINVAFPFLMKVYSDYNSSIIDKSTFFKILDLIQSFTWRRFILGLPTNALNKIFMNLYDKVEPTNYLYSIQKALLQRIGVHRFPKDKEVIEALRIKDVYNIKPKSKFYFLEKLENFDNNERVVIEGNSDITIEHIFPQNPDAKWKETLSDEEYDKIKEEYLHTISNLTLSGNNSKLGNKPFQFKRDLERAGYKDSRLQMNKYLSSLEKWDVSELDKRFILIKELFLKIWEYPQIEIELNDRNGEINIFEADSPKGKKLEYAIFRDNKIEVNRVSNLYLEIFKLLFELQPETFFTTELGNRISITKNPTEQNVRSPLAINDTYFIQGHFNNIEKFNRIKLALKIFNLEDELTIKYAKNT